jgi:predicted nuclease of predicted toxin-antitoxin system
LTFLADESVDKQIVDRLRAAGHHIYSIAETTPGIADSQVLELSNEAAAVLLTADKDFGEMIFRQQLTHVGIVLIRLAGLAPEEKAELASVTINGRLEELQWNFAFSQKDHSVFDGVAARTGLNCSSQQKLLAPHRDSNRGVIRFALSRCTPYQELPTAISDRATALQPRRALFFSHSPLAACLSFARISNRHQAP